jgi:hypothetical protein
MLRYQWNEFFYNPENKHHYAIQQRFPQDVNGQPVRKEPSDRQCLDGEYRFADYEGSQGRAHGAECGDIEVIQRYGLGKGDQVKQEQEEDGCRQCFPDFLYNDRYNLAHYTFSSAAGVSAVMTLAASLTQSTPAAHISI